jgi:hypothetical protein
MIKFYERNQISDQKWDQCISRSFNGMVYGYTWYLDIVAGDWAALVENDYESVFPLPYKKRLGITFIYQPFFTQQLGLFSRNLISQEKVIEFLEAIPRQFKRVDLNLNTLNKCEGDEIKFVPQVNHELDLINSYETIRGEYSTNLKRNIKKAESAELSLMKNIKPDGIIRLFRENRGKEIGHLKDAQYLTLKRLLYTSIYKRKAQMLGVFNETNDLIGGAAFLISDKKAIFIFSGMNEEGRNKGAMPFLIDSFIKNNSGKHLTFDFDGSNDENLARFYKSFGSKECFYYKVRINRLPAITSKTLDLGRKVRAWLR